MQTGYTEGNLLNLLCHCPYECMKIDGIQGLTEAQWETLKALGAAPLASKIGIWV